MREPVQGAHVLDYPFRLSTMSSVMMSGCMVVLIYAVGPVL